MKYELIKKDFIRVKKEELAYIDNIAKTSKNIKFTEEEKLVIYRNLVYYQEKLNTLLKELWKEIPKTEALSREKLSEIVIEFDVDKNYLSQVDFDYEGRRKYVLEDLGIDNYSFKLPFHSLFRYCEYRGINVDILLNKQVLIEEPIYIFCGYYDHSKDCYGPCFGNHDDYIDGIYVDIRKSYEDKKEVSKKKMDVFERDKTIIHTKSYVNSYEVREIFYKELLNNKNKTISDCVNKTRNTIDYLSYIRSPKYKEKVLLDRINDLYRDVKGEVIESELLYSGDFVKLLTETYKLPNNKTIKKEKVIKNNGKNAVIVIAITNDKEYIITFQNRIKDKMIGEFPSGYIELGEDPITAARRELLEETGYVSEDVFILDEVYTSLGIDNSITYIVVANSCIKTDRQVINNNEFISYGLFSEKELEYLINNNIISGGMNKMAYYNLQCNCDNCNVTTNNKQIYKTLKKKRNPLDN